MFEILLRNVKKIYHRRIGLHIFVDSFIFTMIYEAIYKYIHGIFVWDLFQRLEMYIKVFLHEVKCVNN